VVCLIRTVLKSGFFWGFLIFFLLSLIFGDASPNQMITSSVKTGVTTVENLDSPSSSIFRVILNSVFMGLTGGLLVWVIQKVILILKKVFR
jgi:hypothetical protein